MRKCDIFYSLSHTGKVEGLPEKKTKNSASGNPGALSIQQDYSSSLSFSHSALGKTTMNRHSQLTLPSFAMQV